MFTDTDDIERELRAALEVQPTTGFEPRVLDAAADRAQTRGVSRTWLGVAAALVLTAGLWALNVSAPPLMPAPERVTIHADPRARIDPDPPARPLARASAGAPALATPGSRQTVASPSVQASHGTSKPEVLVAANQFALINAFAREINGGRVRLIEDTGADERLEILIVPEMTVHPIAIVTLDAASGPGPKGVYE